MREIITNSLESWLDASGATQWRVVHTEVLIDGDKPTRTRPRKPSIGGLIRQTRKAGERGPVRVTFSDGTTITSERDAAIEQLSEADAERMWRERIAKHAAH
jgi:hypothetical protein